MFAHQPEVGRAVLLSFVVAALAVGCGVAGTGSLPDASDPGDLADAGMTVEPDGGAADAGIIDAGIIDAGTFDAGTFDAGIIDAGTFDAGTVDAGPRPSDAGCAASTSDLSTPFPGPTQCPTSPVGAGVFRYVNPATGNDASNPGTFPSTPLKTVAKALGLSAPGDVVLLATGTYRERVDYTGAGGTAAAPLTLRAAPGAQPVLKGSVLVTGFAATVDAGVYQRTYDEAALLDGQPVGAPQQVFVDGAGLRQVGPPVSMPACATPNAGIPCMTSFGTGVADVAATPGTFYFDPNAHTLSLHLLDDSAPALHQIEVSVRRRVLFLSQNTPWMCVEGLTFKHSNATGLPGVQQESGVHLSSKSVLANSVVEQMDFTGVNLGFQQDGARLSYVIARNNGGNGIGGANSSNVIVERSQALGNNARGFGTLWHSGGLKFAGATSSGVIRDSRFEQNTGPGVWCDFCGGNNLQVLRNRFVGNTREGQIFIEVSDGATVANNLIITDRGDANVRGIYISESDQARVFFNTIVRLTPSIGIDIKGGSRGTANDAQVLGNLVASLGSVTTTADLRVGPSSGTTAVLRLRSDSNLFFNENGTYRFVFAQTSLTLADWKTASGLDPNSVSANPLFTASASGNYSLTTGSPAVDQLATTVVTDDALGNARPQGPRGDLGGFERCTP